MSPAEITLGYDRTASTADKTTDRIDWIKVGTAGCEVPICPAKLMILSTLRFEVAGIAAIASPTFGSTVAGISVTSANAMMLAIVCPLTTVPAGNPERIASNLVRAAPLIVETIG